MSAKTPPQMTAVLLILGGAVFVVLGGLHATYTLLDIRYPRRLVPVDPSVAQAMANSALRLSRGGTDMWRAWIGFNFSHSLGVFLVGALGVWAGCRIKTLPVSVVMPVLTLIGCAYEVLDLLRGFATKETTHQKLNPALFSSAGSPRDGGQSLSGECLMYCRHRPRSKLPFQPDSLPSRRACPLPARWCQ
jgi:hypothetical protein